MSAALQSESEKPGAALRLALTAAAHEQGGDASRLRAAAVPLFKQALAEARGEARSFLERGGTGLGTAQMLSRSQDTLILGANGIAALTFCDVPIAHGK